MELRATSLKGIELNILHIRSAQVYFAAKKSLTWGSPVLTADELSDVFE